MQLKAFLNLHHGNFKIKGCYSKDSMALRSDSSKNLKTPKPNTIDAFVKKYLTVSMVYSAQMYLNIYHKT